MSKKKTHRIKIHHRQFVGRTEVIEINFDDIKEYDSIANEIVMGDGNVYIPCSKKDFFKLWKKKQ